MRYCQSCGNELEDGALFCGVCGQSQNTAIRPARKPHTSYPNKLHCPQCKSTAISPVVETEISGGTAVSHSFTRKTSGSSFRFNNTHRNYWMCSDCGYKFRNLQNLEEEIASLRKTAKSGVYGIILLVVLGLFCCITIGAGFTLVLLVPILILVVVSLFIIKGKIDAMESERAYLKKNCFG